MRNKVTIEDAHDAIKAFTEQSKSNIALGILADTEHMEMCAFIKGEENEILATIVMQMAKSNNLKNLLFKAVEIYKIAPMQKILSNENKHSRDN